MQGWDGAPHFYNQGELHMVAENPDPVNRPPGVDNPPPLEGAQLPPETPGQSFDS